MDGVLKMTQKPLNALMAGLMALGLSQAAFAANSVPFPQLADPTTACHNVGPGLALNSPPFYNACINQAQEGYDNARMVWDRLSQHSAELCLNLATTKAPGPAYQYAGVGKLRDHVLSF